MGYYILYIESSIICVDTEEDIILALQALERAVEPAFVKKVIGIVDVAVTVT